MAEWVSTVSGYLWQNGLAVVPLVLLVAVATRVLPCRPATRHMMWVMVLLWLIAPPMLPGVENPWVDAVATSEITPGSEPSSDLIIERPPLASRGMEHAALAGKPPVGPGEQALTPNPSPKGRGEVAVRVTPHVARGRSGTKVPDRSAAADQFRGEAAKDTGKKLRTMEASAPLLEPASPWRTARADDTGHSLLAQAGDAAGLPPDAEKFTAARASGQWGPYCPMPAEVEQICRVEPRHQSLESHPRVPAQQPFLATRTPESGPVLRSQDEARFADSSRWVSESGNVPALEVPRFAREDEALADKPPVAPGLEMPRLAEDGEREQAGAVSAQYDENSVPVLMDTTVSDGSAAPWQQWAGVALRMRDDLASLPAVPTDIWIGGVVVLLVVAGVRVIRFRQLVRKASAPSAGTKQMVADVCRCAGLRRAPDVWMVEGALSPMVWCVLRPRLLIPVQLWADLDEVGRRAVIMHELAHLRRRDHWVLWIESAVGGLFWWHPLVWWVRRRVHLEAEYCCDAWVTTLLPRTRRAYAEALLRTRQYVGENRPILPAMGMGISSGRAKRFARRLTMVMTNTTKPGVSVWGVSLVLLLAATGWLASPARSCPEEEAKKHECAKASANCAAAECAKASANCAGTDCPKAIVASEKVQAGAVVTPAPPGQTSYEKHMAAKAFGVVAPAQPAPVAVAAPSVQPGMPIPAIAPAIGGWVVAAGQDDDEGKAKKRRKAEGDGRVEALEAQLEALGEQLERLAEQLEAAKGGDGRSDDGDTPRMRVRTPRPPRAPRAPQAGQPALPPMPPMPPQGHAPHAFFHAPTPAPTEFPKPGQTWADVSEEETEWRTYTISEGKLDDFTKLMSRPDVPILVRSKDDAIEIQATPRQHRIINGFLQLIDPSEERAQADHEHGYFGLLTGQNFGGELEALRVYGLGSGQGGGHGACGGECSKCACDKCKEVKAHRKEAEKIRADARKMATELRARAEGEAGRARAEAQERARETRDRLRQEARKIRVEARNQEEIRRGLEREAEALREQAERMREKAERARERAQQLRERSEESTEPQGAIMEHIEVLERTAEALTEQGAEIESKAEEVLAYGQTVESDGLVLDQHADEVDVRAETIEEIVGSVEHLEVGPELAESIAQLAREIESAAGLANCDAGWLSAISRLSAVELAQPDVGAALELQEVLRAAELREIEAVEVEAQEEAIEALREAELEGAEIREAAVEALLESQLQQEQVRKEALEAALKAEQEKAKEAKKADDGDDLK